MDSPKYLVVITLVEGQNFTLPDCVIDRTAQATVFAEARFDNEPLRSDPVKLVNTNPEFVTELAWQLDRRSLHQFRIERRAIKLQVFLQTTPIKKASPAHSRDKNIDDSSLSGSIGSSYQLETNQIQLVGYTVIHVRTIQERNQPKFEWRPLLNPKFRKPSYNRPEIQLAVTLIKCEDNPLENVSNGPRNSSYVSRFQKTDLNSSLMENLDAGPDQLENPDECGQDDDDIDSSNPSVDSQLYKTCLDYTIAHNYDNNKQEDNSRVAIIENDINIKVIDGHHYIYDALKGSSTIEECKNYFCLEVSIAFISDLEAILLGHTRDYLDSTSNLAKYYFTFSLFGSALKSEEFTIKECNLRPKFVKFTLATASAELLNTYFTLNSALDIKFCNEHKKILGFAAVQLDQLCCDIEADLRNGRSIEGMFSLQSCADNPVDYLEGAGPTVGVAVVLKEVDSLDSSPELAQRPVLKSPTAKYFDQTSSPSRIDNKTVQNSTLNQERIPTVSDRKKDLINLQDLGRQSSETQSLPLPRMLDGGVQTSEFLTDLFNEDQMRHFCFTIDLKTLTTLDNIMMDLSNLLIRYSYSFFGYTDTITTESIIPIGPHEATIPHGFCEFNFATTLRSLQYAFDKVPLILELVVNQRSEHLNGQEGNIYNDEDLESAGFCQIRLATLFDVDRLRFNDDYCTMTSTTILGCDKSKLGNLQLYLSLKDLGPTRIDQNIRKDDTGNKAGSSLPANINDRVNFVSDIDKLLADASNEIESWKDQQLLSFKNELQQKEQEYLSNITHKLEAKETKRDAELKKKMTDLNKLERKLRNALLIVESKEKHLDQKEHQLNTKDKELSDRLATIDLEVSKAIEEVIASYQRKDSDSNKTINEESQNKISKISYGLSQPIRATRRSSLRDHTATSSRSPGIPLPVRSTSLVRGSIEGKPPKFPLRFNKNGNNSATTGSSTRIPSTTSSSRSSLVRPGSFKSTVNKDTQEKLICLRKERADLLKKGCRPTDNLIIEINALIERLARK